jgi:hypothetical protein
MPGRSPHRRRRNCELLSRQVAPLEAWIDAEPRPDAASACSGDFNRRFTIEKGPARDEQGRQLNVYKEIDDGEPRRRSSRNITGQAKFTPCTKDSEYREYIDNILLGRDLAQTVLKKSFVRVSSTTRTRRPTGCRITARWASSCPEVTSSHTSR